MIVATIDRIDGYRIARVCGFVFGKTARTRGLWGRILSDVEGVLGGEGKAYKAEFAKAKDAALRLAEEEAAAMGANAILGADLDIAEIRDGYLLASITGTAVFLERVDAKHI
jgi:uncharacterized protein YbjQ (UPF0145 family)